MSASELSDRPSIHGDDAISSFQAALSSRARQDNVDDVKEIRLRFEFNSKPDKVAVDLGHHFGILVGRQKARIPIQCHGGPRRNFEHNEWGWDSVQFVHHHTEVVDCPLGGIAIRDPIGEGFLEEVVANPLLDLEVDRDAELLAKFIR